MTHKHLSEQIGQETFPPSNSEQWAAAQCESKINPTTALLVTKWPPALGGTVVGPVWAVLNKESWIALHWDLLNGYRQEVMFTWKGNKLWFFRTLIILALVPYLCVLKWSVIADTDTVYHSHRPRLLFTGEFLGENWSVWLHRKYTTITYTNQSI